MWKALASLMEDNTSITDIVLHHMYESLPKPDQRRADVVEKATANNYKMSERSSVKEREEL